MEIVVFVWAAIFWILIDVLVGVYAAKKGLSGVGFFFLSLLLSPLVGFIVAFAQQPEREAVEARQLNSGGVVKCPYCAELIKSEAIVCKHCGRDLSDMVATTKRQAEQATAAAEAAAARQEQERIAANRAQSKLLCSRLAVKHLSLTEYQELAQGAGATVGLRTGIVSTHYVVTRNGQEVAFKRLKQLRPWFIENIVPVVNDG